MFKKLRRKFLLLNIFAITTVIFFTFICTFLISYANVKKNIDDELTKMLNDNKINNEEKKKDELINNMVPDDKPSMPYIGFTVLLDENKNVESINVPNYLDLTDSFVNDLVTDILSKKKTESLFKYDGRYYSFKMIEFNDGYKLCVIDSSKNISILYSFIYGFLIVYIVSSILIILFSIYFSKSAVDPIEESFDKQKRFVMDASHELRTPLTVINTSVDLVLSNPNKTVSSQERWLNYIKEETLRLSKLVSSLLMLAENEDNAENILFTKVDLSTLLNNVILSMEALIFDINIKLNTTIEDNIFVYGNSDLIKQLVIILIDNAIKYNIKDGYINIKLYRKSKEIVLIIDNSCDYIDNDVTNKLFDRFYRQDESRNNEQKGYGIGLAIAKTITNSHNATIDASTSNNNDLSIIVKFKTYKDE